MTSLHRVAPPSPLNKMVQNGHKALLHQVARPNQVASPPLLTDGSLHFIISFIIHFLHQVHNGCLGIITVFRHIFQLPAQNDSSETGVKCSVTKTQQCD